MAASSFTGDRKEPMRSPVAAPEKRLVQWLTPRFPRRIEGYHLTLLTIAWSAGLLACGWLARGRLDWLWGASLMLFLQWFTDSLDGALGRHRDTGLRRWGFYMDHLLDFIFMSSVFVGYAFLLPAPGSYWMLALGFAYACMMVHSFLAYGATGGFQITYLGLGPTEIRLFFILLNTAIILSGRADWLAPAAPWAFAAMCLAFLVIVRDAHRRIWALDMQEKNQARNPRAGENEAHPGAS